MIDRIKEPTFNDLIDAAAQAFKDGKLAKVTMMSNGLIYLTTHDIRVKSVSDDIPSSGIDFIKSLYTETFVIERESDMKKIKGSAESIMLVNGEDVGSNIIIHNDEPHFFFDNAVVPAVFKLLKGAIVTQEVSK